MPSLRDAIPNPDGRPITIDGVQLAGVLALAMTCLVALAAAFEGQTVLALLVLVAVPAMIWGLLNPEWAAPIVVFVVYSNAAVVAVRFHGVPSVAAMLVPAPLLVPLAYDVLFKREPLILTPTLRWIVAYIGVQFVSALGSRDPRASLEGVVGTVCEGLLVYLVVTNVVRTPQRLRKAVWALLAAGAFMGSISVYQQATGSFHTQLGGFGQVSRGEGFKVADGHGTRRQRRLAGPIGEKNRYSQIMLMLLPLGLCRFWSEKRTAPRALALACAGLAAAGTALTFSRGGAIACGLMMILAVMLRFISWKQILTLCAGSALVLLLVPEYRSRLETVTTVLGAFDSSASREEPDGAIRGRLTEMLATARMAADHPLLGVGPGLSGTYTREYGRLGGLRALEGNRESHCMYLEIPAETGLLGLAAFAGMMMVSLTTLWRNRLRIAPHDRELEQTVTGFLFAMTAYLASGLFLHMSYIRYFWLMLALADATHYVVRSHLAVVPSERMHGDVAKHVSVT